MNIRSIAPNQIVVTLDNGTTIFISYATAVAAWLPHGIGSPAGAELWREATSSSRTTARHINGWVKAECFDHLKPIPKTNDQIQALLPDVSRLHKLSPLVPRLLESLGGAVLNSVAWIEAGEHWPESTRKEYAGDLQRRFDALAAALTGDEYFFDPEVMQAAADGAWPNFLRCAAAEEITAALREAADVVDMGIPFGGSPQHRQRSADLAVKLRLLACNVDTAAAAAAADSAANRRAAEVGVVAPRRPR